MIIHKFQARSRLPVTLMILPRFRYRPSPDTFTFTSKRNKCYCRKDEKGNKICPPKGVFDISTCINDMPIVMSFPHFLKGDESLLKQIDGLHPRQEDHMSYMDVNPVSRHQVLNILIDSKRMLSPTNARQQIFFHSRIFHIISFVSTSYLYS